MNNVKWRRLLPGASQPTYWQSEGLVSLPLYARSGAGHPVKIVLPPQNLKLIQTGLTFEYPDGVVPFLLARKDAAKKGLVVANTPVPVTPGTEVTFVLQNLSLEVQYLEHGDVIAQLLFLSAAPFQFAEVTP